MTEELQYYASHGWFTRPETARNPVPALPDGIGALVGVVQNTMIHAHWLPRYGVAVSDERRNREMNLRTFRERMENIRELAGSISIDSPALNGKKSIGTCRDFTLTLTALLREKGIPARERCGFATYFLPDHFEDHWVCEWWDTERKRWILTDAQLDTLQTEALQTDFDPLDVPRNRFITGGAAWRMCRKNGADPDTFGIFEYHGMDFIKGNLIRDAAALNKVPLLPWDCWGLIENDYGKLPEPDLVFLDTLAGLTETIDGFSRIRTIYDTDTRVKMTGTIRSYSPVGGTIRLETGVS